MASTIPSPLANLIRNVQTPNPTDRSRDLQMAQMQQSILSLSQSISAINAQILELNGGIKKLGVQLQTEANLDQKNTKDEQESERRLEERNVRLGQESVLEKKITSALASPIVSLQQKVTNTFGNIMGALQTVFFGWLTNQGIETLKALASGNTKKLEEIKWTVIKNVAGFVGIFAAANFGIGLLLRTITGLSRKVIQLGAKLAFAPFRALGSGLQTLIRGGKPGGGTPPVGAGTPPVRGGTPPRGGKPAGGIGTLFGAGMEAFQGNWLEAALGASAFLPGPVGAIGKGLFWGEQALDFFGKGLIPESGGQQTQQPSSSSSSTPSATPSPATPTPTSTTTTPPPTPAPATPSSRPSQTPSPTPQSSQPRSISLTPIMEPTTFTTVGSENQPLINPANTQTSSSTSSSSTITPGAGSLPDYSSTFSSSQLQPPQIQAPQTQQQPIVPVPERPPNIIIAGGNNQTTQMISPDQQPVTDVPLIPSSNPDNFYTLYSQLSYNVVM